MENLTQKVLQYQKTHEGLQDLVRELAPRVYQFPRRKMGWDEDACGEFYVFIHPRLIRLLDRFRDQGKPFESYLCAVLNWQLRNLARERKYGERRWNVSLRLEQGTGANQETDDEESRPDREESLLVPGSLSRIICTRADRRNFLFLLLKCSRSIEPVNAPLLAEIAGIDAERLAGLASLLQDMRSRREARLETFRHRRNRAFAHARLLEAELKTEIEPERVAILTCTLSRTRRRMRLAMTRMARVGLSPTNREIAAVLGVPKGTVDSGLYWLKRKLASVYDPNIHRAA